jgi:two-component system, NtrC family, response regulator AtoC
MSEPKKKILVVDDDEEMRSLLQDFFADEGLLPFSAENGSEAFRKMAGEDFDVVITDIRMPGLSGLEILPKMKRMQPQAFILAITAFGDEEVKQKALERGAGAYLEKPIQLQQLRGLLRKILDPRSAKTRV